MTPRDLTTMLKNWDDMFQFDPTPSGECHASEMVLSGTTLGFFNLTPLAVGKVTPARCRLFLRASDFNRAPRNARNYDDEGRNGGSVGERISSLPRWMRGVVTGIPREPRLASKTFNSTPCTNGEQEIIERHDYGTGEYPFQLRPVLDGDSKT
jgi:hypothetical protein